MPTLTVLLAALLGAVSRARSTPPTAADGVDVYLTTLHDYRSHAGATGLYLAESSYVADPPRRSQLGEAPTAPESLPTTPDIASSGKA